LKHGQILVKHFNVQFNGNPFRDSRHVYGQTDTAELTGHFYVFTAGIPKKNKFSSEFRTTFKANGGESGSSWQHVDTLKYAKGLDQLK
jgi:hypothetical protein